MHVAHIKPFIPSKDFEISIEFYTEIGFTPEPVTEDLILFRNTGTEFFLQRFYVQELADNFMLQICVKNIEAAFASCNDAKHKAKISQITQEDWGKVFYLWGPSGELLHMTELKIR